MSASVGVAARQDLLDALGQLAEEKTPRTDAADALEQFEIDDQDQRAKFCERYALHPSFVLLVFQLAGAEGRHRPKYWSKIHRLIAGVADDTDTSKVVGGWIADIWEQNLRSRISDAELRSAGDRIGDLHRRASAGEIVTRQDWRAARKAIEASAAVVGGEDARWARVIAAGAWDVESTPAVGSELVNTWGTELMSYLATQTAEIKAQTVALLAARSGPPKTPFPAD